MDNKKGMKWTRDETILAFDLYCRIPFGKIHHSNADIINLAELIGRTPSAVALKMQNLAHHDPAHRKRNVIAMAHGSKLDGEIFNEFSHDWDELAYQAQKIKAQLKNVNIEEIIDIEELESIPAGEYREQMIKTRVGQYFFRMAVLSSYGNRCCITGLSDMRLLIASHIKPWAESDAKTEKTNPSNGLCLNSMHDKAFDKGLITIGQDYRIIISKALKDVWMDQRTREWLMSYENERIMLPDKFLPESR